MVIVRVKFSPSHLKIMSKRKKYHIKLLLTKKKVIAFEYLKQYVNFVWFIYNLYKNIVFFVISKNQKKAYCRQK